MTKVNRELVKEIEASDPEELVVMLGISSEQLIRAFPGHAYDYIRENFTDGTTSDEDFDEDAGYRELEEYLDEY